MDKSQEKGDEALRWEQERRVKQAQMDQQLQQFLPIHFYSFLSFEASDSFQLASDDWPNNKWQDGLFLQVGIAHPEAINSIMERFSSISSVGYSYIFLMKYNFGLVQIDNNQLLNTWQQLIEVDGEELTCYLPNRSDFISIQKTEEVMEGREHEGMQWLYEVTFSNAAIKKELTEQST